MSKKKQILFVDDEQGVLDGLRRMLRSMRDEWDIFFACSGEEALRIMATRPFDVICSDLRMPGVSGVQLLSKVRDKYPWTIRIMLSGESDTTKILQSVGPVHQFLQKPCDATTLKATITRTCELGRLFEDQRLRSMITEIETLPSLPSVYEELLAQLEMPDISAKVLGETISRDVAMTAKLLKLVNSSFFGVRRRVTAPADAVSLLGLDTLRSLVVTIQIFSWVSTREVKWLSQELLLLHSADVGAISKTIARLESAASSVLDDCLMAGLLHDIGKLVCAMQAPDRLAAARALAKSQAIPMPDAERQAIGASHAEIGAYLLGLWGFSDPIVDAVAYHHTPERSHDEGFTVLTGVHVANSLAHMSEHDDSDSAHDVSMPYLERIGLSHRVSAWRDSCLLLGLGHISRE